MMAVHDTPYRHSGVQRGFALAVLLLFLYNAAGYTVVFTALRHAVQKEVKAMLKRGVPESDLHVLVIPQSVERDPQSSFRRIHDGEFRYRGRMYDIVRKDIRGDTTVYYCINDIEEEQLFARLDDHVRSHLPNSAAAGNTSARSALKLVVRQAIPPVAVVSILPSSSVPPPAEPCAYPTTVDTDIPTPPPEPLLRHSPC